MTSVSDRISTPCAACGSNTLFVDGATGSLVCNLIGCSDPLLTDRVLSDPYAREHVVTFREDGFAVQHPLTERGDDLTACELHRYIADLDGPPVRPGRYVARLGEGDRWSWREIA